MSGRGSIGLEMNQGLTRRAPAQVLITSDPNVSAGSPDVCVNRSGTTTGELTINPDRDYQPRK